MKIFLLLLFPLFVHAQPPQLRYTWRKIAGPSQYTIVAPHSAHTNVTNLTVGVYQFELKVTNAQGLSARDTMKVTVRPPEGVLASNRRFLGSASLAAN